MNTNYQKQALDFATKYGVKLSVIGDPEYKQYWPEDKQCRYVFKLRLTRRGKGSYVFTFGQSINAGAEEPTMYDILACMTKSDPGSFHNFCQDYGYSEYSIQALRTYKAVCKEYQAVSRLFPDPDCQEKLYEIN
jgi:hypothetical protein